MEDLVVDGSITVRRIFTKCGARVRASCVAGPWGLGKALLLLLLLLCSMAHGHTSPYWATAGNLEEAYTPKHTGAGQLLNTSDRRENILLFI